MKITSIKYWPIRLEPVKVGYRPSDALSQIAQVDTVIVQVETDRDVIGWGEAATIRSYFNQTLGTLLDWLDAYSKALKGMEVQNVIAIHRRMDLVSGEWPPGCQPARAAIDMALYDILGKTYHCPVYEILGGAYRTEFSLLTNLYEDTPEEKARACKEYVEKGYTGLKVKVGDKILLHGLSQETLELEKEKLRAALETVPPNVYIDADANQAWRSPQIAIRIVRALLEDKYYPNLALEQPLHYLDFEGHRHLRNVLHIPIILDESVTSVEAMIQIVRNNAADRIVLKPNRVGGLYWAVKIKDIAEAAGIGISLDTMPFTKLGDTMLCHLAATIKEPYPVDAEGHTWFKRTPFTGGIEIKNGRAILPKKDGFGVELDENVLRELSRFPKGDPDEKL